MTVTDKIALPYLIFDTRDLFLKKKEKKKGNVLCKSV